MIVGLGRLDMGLGRLARCGLICWAADVICLTVCCARCCPLRAAAMT